METLNVLISSVLVSRHEHHIFAKNMNNSVQFQRDSAEDISPSFFENSQCPGNIFENPTLNEVQNDLNDELTQLDMISSEHVGSWTKSLSFLPNLTSEHIDSKLVHGSATAMNAPKAFRNKRHGYRLWREGFVREIWVKPNVAAKSCLFIVRAKVHASMKSTCYSVYVHLDQNNAEILYAKCSCKAGQGGCCKHVAALLYTLMDYVNIDAEGVPADLTCTQVSQKWHIPTSANMTLKKAVKFNYLIFEKSEENKKRKRPVVSGVRENFCATPSFAHTLLPEELHNLVRNLSACNSSALFCRAVESNNFQPCTIFDTSCSRNIREKDCLETVNAPENGLFDSIFTKMGNDVTESLELKNKEKIIKLVGVSCQEASNICFETKMQTASNSWYNERIKRITASFFGKVMNRREAIYPTSIVKSIINQKKSHTMPAALKWGIENEKVALDGYTKNYLEDDMEVMEIGLVVNPKWPWLGCSPDGLVMKKGLPDGCIEIKCPFSKRHSSIQEAIGDKTFFLCQKNSRVQLKRNHLYYYQCQGVINILELSWIDFVVYTTKEIYVERILSDTDLWNKKMLPKLTSFYVDFIFPEIVKQSE